MFNNNQWLQFALPGPRLHQGREQDAANQSARSKSSGRDAQQRGATAAAHDDDYPRLSRIGLDCPERQCAAHDD
jgi:hypothetical protein